MHQGRTRQRGPSWAPLGAALLGALGGPIGCGGDEAPAPSDPLAACAALVGPTPQSVADVVAQLNQLPEPRTLPCYLASLPRPLYLVATSSPFSLQPADGPLAPRIFILTRGLVLSVVPKGPGSELLELGEYVAGGRTVKGELHFPLEGEVADVAPYEQILGSETLTRCAACHRGEAPHPNRPKAFISEAYRPREETLLPFEELASLRQGCDAEDGEHCVILRALFDYGPVLPTAFPDEIDTFF